MAPAVPARVRGPVRRWMDWRVAAAVTMITLGGLSLAVTDRLGVGADIDTTPSRIDSTTVAVGPTTRPGDSGRAIDTGRGAAGRTPAAARGATTPQLSFGGGVGDLDAESIEALMGALDELDRAPVAPSAEPDRAPVLPVISEGPL